MFYTSTRVVKRGLSKWSEYLFVCFFPYLFILNVLYEYFGSKKYLTPVWSPTAVLSQSVALWWCAVRLLSGDLGLVPAVWCCCLIHRLLCLTRSDHALPTVLKFCRLQLTRLMPWKPRVRVCRCVSVWVRWTHVFFMQKTHKPMTHIKPTRSWSFSDRNLCPSFTFMWKSGTVVWIGGSDVARSQRLGRGKLRGLGGRSPPVESRGGAPVGVWGPKSTT